MNNQQLTDLIDQGYVFYVSHSGGKDSQAMYSLITNQVPHDQVVVVHADLGEVEHLGVQDHIAKNTDHPTNVVSAVWKDGSAKDLLGYVEHRYQVRPDAPSWPSAAARWCTSELKTGPIYKFIRADMKQRGALLAVNCMGIRAEESSARAKKNPWKLNKVLSKAGRTIYDWMPIHDMLIAEVWSTIAEAGQEPHAAYAAGYERLSCAFCILANANDLAIGKQQRPALFAKYEALEQRTGYTMFHKQSLADKIATVTIG